MEKDKPIKVLNLNLLKDVPSRGTTTHLVNIFSRINPDEIEFYSFLTNKDFIKGSIKPLEEFGSYLLGIPYGLLTMWRIKPDIILGVGSPYELAYYLLRPRRSKYLIGWHGPLDRNWMLGIGGNSLYTRLSYRIAIFLVKHSSAILCDSEYIKKSVVSLFPQKLVYLTGNGVDNKVFAPEKRDKKFIAGFLKLKTERPIVIYMAHLIKRKRPEVIVELAKRMPNVEFLVIGRQGDYSEEEMKTLDDSLPNFHYRASVSRKDLPVIMSSCELLVFPTLNEPFGLTTIEAMSSGLPVVASASGGTVEIVRDGMDGFLVPLEGDEIGEFIKRIKEIVFSGLWKTMSENGRKRAVSVYNWESVTEVYRRAILQVSEK